MPTAKAKAKSAAAKSAAAKPAAAKSAPVKPDNAGETDGDKDAPRKKRRGKSTVAAEGDQKTEPPKANKVKKTKK